MLWEMKDVSCVRESGTEPLIRVMVEAGTDELCHEKCRPGSESNGSRRSGY